MPVLAGRRASYPATLWKQRQPLTPNSSGACSLPAPVKKRPGTALVRRAIPFYLRHHPLSLRGRTIRRTCPYSPRLPVPARRPRQRLGA